MLSGKKLVLKLNELLAGDRAAMSALFMRAVTCEASIATSCEAGVPKISVLDIINALLTKRQIEIDTDGRSIVGFKYKCRKPL